ncbi:MAG: hypothetical protein NTV82_02555, partial [Candidatus Aminicenantes bacterium]|nr:hypothetical protein [Candidatus Aminicenantes bacterium]
FRDLTKPFLYQEKAERPLSPFKIIGFMLIALGLCMAAISILVLVYYKDPSAFKVDLIVALTIVGLGVLMRFGKKSKKAQLP